MSVRDHLLTSGLFTEATGRSIAGRVDAKKVVLEALDRHRRDADRRLELFVWLTFDSFGELERLELKCGDDAEPSTTTCFTPPDKPARPARWPEVPADTLFGLRELADVAHAVIHGAQVLLAVELPQATNAAGVLLLAAGELQHLRHAAEGRVPLAELPQLAPPRTGPGSRSRSTKPALQAVAAGVLRAVSGFLWAAADLLRDKADETSKLVVSRLVPALALTRELLALYEQRTAGAFVLRPEVDRLVDVQGRLHG